MHADIVHVHTYTEMHAHALDPVKCEVCGTILCRYPWHVVFTGIRILIEAGDILNGNYFANNDEGQYIGYQ